jgi:hypothetical protein
MRWTMVELDVDKLDEHNPSSLLRREAIEKWTS